jgi:hypothetical protein
MAVRTNGNAGLSASERLTEAEVLLSSIGPLVKDKYMVNIQGNKYLQVAGAASLGWALGYTTRLLSCERAASGDHWVSVAEVIDTATGEIVGRGHGHVFDDENPWGKRPQHARAAMCQTRAQGRALKGVVGWLFGMLGAETSLIEEMPPDAFNDRNKPQLEAAQTASVSKQATQAPETPAQAVQDEVPPVTTEEMEVAEAAPQDRPRAIRAVLVGKKEGDPVEIRPSFIDQYQKKGKDAEFYWFVKTSTDKKFVVWDTGVAKVLEANKGLDIECYIREASNPDHKPTIVGVMDDDIPF